METLITAAFLANSLYCPREIAKIIAEHWIDASLPNWRQKHARKWWGVMEELEDSTKVIRRELSENNKIANFVPVIVNIGLGRWIIIWTERR